MHLHPAGAADSADIDLLLDAAFEPGRHLRTAYKLRQGVTPYADLSLIGRERGRLVGSIQYWPCELWDGERAHALTLLGPVAVAPDLQGTGLGKQLMTESLAQADAAGHGVIILIGDPEYYGRFGFEAAPTAAWAVPGPVERRRLLARLAPGVTLPVAGELRSLTSAPVRVRHAA
ncbi:GNAT family N-acetyltransferase [Sphingoaurantiacus capsulatus]|uniref:GNAT family N-acetyltransferase n=1 Tax=Sphingoaurantiacus capsulatus TaxID=1771310 RepID=A0ABV7XFV9_9SPHN